MRYMTKVYTPTNGTHAKIFRQAPEQYPVIDLPVKVDGKEYRGPSNLAHFILWKAMDENPVVAERFADRKLWLMGNFMHGRKDLLFVDLQSHRRVSLLRIHTPNGLELTMTWDRRGDGHAFKDIKHGIDHGSDGELPLETAAANEPAIGLLPARALQRNLGDAVLRNPAAGAAVIFGDYETQFSELAQRGALEHTLRPERV